MDFTNDIKKKHYKNFVSKKTLIDYIENYPLTFSKNVLEGESEQCKFAKYILSRLNPNVRETKEGRDFYDKFAAIMVNAAVTDAELDNPENPTRMDIDMHEYYVTVSIINDQEVGTAGNDGYEHPKNYVAVMRNRVLGEQLELHYGENTNGFYMDSIRHGNAPVITYVSNVVGLEDQRNGGEVKVYDSKRLSSRTTVCSSQGKLILSKGKEVIQTPPEDEKVELRILPRMAQDINKDIVLDYDSSVSLSAATKRAERILPHDCYQSYNSNEITQ